MLNPDLYFSDFFFFKQGDGERTQLYLFTWKEEAFFETAKIKLQEL